MQNYLDLFIQALMYVEFKSDLPKYFRDLVDVLEKKEKSN